MRVKKFLLLLLMLSVLACCYSQQKRKLIWSDEFNYVGLPDSTKWDYEHGYIRNEEKQYYTWKRKQNVWVHDGYLEIKAIKELFRNHEYKPGSNNWKTADSLARYTSASINTLGKVSWKYGRIEVRAKLPKGAGVWPAIWMMGVNRPKVDWPRCGEIDIMEFVGFDSSHVYGTIHYAREDGVNHSSSGNKIEVHQPYNKFHVYALEWNKNKMKIFYDDTLYHTFSTKDINKKGRQSFQKPFYLLLNLALGGAWGGKIDDDNLPQSFLVDYVRVYK